MSTNIHILIKNEYEKRQKLAHDNLMERKAELYSKLPRLEEIENEIHLSGIKCNKLILLYGKESKNETDELLTRINLLRLEKEKLLETEGYDRHYLDVSYQCPSCKDTGYIQNNSVSERCVCYKQQLINHLYNQSNLKLTELENFSSFNERYYPDSIDERRYGITVSPRQNILSIKKRCEKFIENFASSDEMNLFFSGPTGVGKTFMCNCIAMELINNGRTVLYQTAPVLFDIISEHKAKSFKDEDFEDSGYKDIFDVELLIIDDLGTEPTSAARYAELLTILNTRHINNLTKPCKTIISTNLGAKKLQEVYTERVMSRIIGCFDRLMFAGEDIRSLKAR